MINEEAQKELCRSIKLPDEKSKSALWYERGDKHTKNYKLTLQIKAEPISSIRERFRRPL